VSYVKPEPEPEPVSHVEPEPEPEPEREPEPDVQPTSADVLPAPEATNGEAPAASTNRPAFARTSAERLSHMPVRRPEQHDDDDEDEPLRGTLAPVLRHSTQRAQYPAPTRPAIRAPLGEPGSATPAAPPTWQEALSGDVVPGDKRARPERVSRPRHESGGAGDYKQRGAPDRSLTLLVTTMLLILLALVGVAVWAFWPRSSGTAGALPPEHVRTTPTAVVRGP
jgi:hypothetical protein